MRQTGVGPQGGYFQGDPYGRGSGYFSAHPGGYDPQRMYYPRRTGSMPNNAAVPQTPFDPVYGFTLLPSHLVMGSPFVNTPQSAIPGGDGGGFGRNPMSMRNSSVIFSPPPRLGPPPKGRPKREDMSGRIDLERRDSSSSWREPSEFRSGGDPEAYGEDKNGVSTGRDSTPESISQAGEMVVDYDMPVTLHYRILPKGSDTYRSRSLLFSKISNTVTLSQFVNDIVKDYQIESVYQVPPLRKMDRIAEDDDEGLSPQGTRTDEEKKFSSNTNNNTNTNTNSAADADINIQVKDNTDSSDSHYGVNHCTDEETIESASLLIEKSSIVGDGCKNDSFIDQSKNNSNEVIPETLSEGEELKNTTFLLNFVTKETCLHFYNNLLQRFAAAKKSLMAEELSMNFVAIEDSFGITDLKMSIVSLGATRYLYVGFSKEVTVDNIWQLLPQLKGSKRFVVHDVILVNTLEKKKHFDSNYAIIHFASIKMALEVKRLLELVNDSINNVFFVIQNNDAENENRRKSSVISLQNEDLRASVDSRAPYSRSRASDISLPFSEKNRSKSTDLDESEQTDFSVSNSSDSLGQWRTVIVNPEDYCEPVITLLDINAPGWSVSKPISFYVNGTENEISSSTLSDDMVDPISIRNGMAVPQELVVNDYPYLMEPIMAPQITQTMQNQYSKSIQTLNAGIEHRTVYIGNINPRSKPEDICNVVRGGILQNIKWVAHKHVCFVTFIETASAVQFYANAILEPIVLHGNVLKVGWGQNPGPLPKKISLAVTVGASRNVYVSLPDIAFKDKFINDPKFADFKFKYTLPGVEHLKKDFSIFGPMEQINFHPDGHCCWINFMNITSAITMVEQANDARTRTGFHEKFNNQYEGLIIGYGKDRCGNMNKNLAANKNPRHNKKAKKHSSSQISFELESEMRQVSLNSKLSDDINDKDYLSLTNNEYSEGLGITLSPNSRLDDVQSDTEEAPDSTFVNEKASLEPTANPSLNNKSLFENEQRHTTENATESAMDYSASSSDESDVIITTTRSKKMEIPVLTTDSKEFVPGYSFTSYQPNSNYVSHSETSFTSNTTRGKHQKHRYLSRPANTQRPRKSSAKPLAGSEVMTRYLEQLHHNTLMYATNVLGAAQDSSLYDEDSI